MGRADLLRLVTAGGGWAASPDDEQTKDEQTKDEQAKDEQAKIVAAIGSLGLGYERRTPPVATTTVETVIEAEAVEVDRAQSSTATSQHATPQLQWVQDAAPALLWRAVEHTLYEVPTEQPPPPPRAERGWAAQPAEPAPFAPLLTWGQIVPRLRALLGAHFPTREIDIPRAIDVLAEGEVPESLPARSRRQWGSTLQIWFDLSTRLIPYYDDFELVRSQLVRRLGDRQIEFFSGHDPVDLVWSYADPDNPQPGYHAPPPGTNVLILGDLGALDRSGEPIRQKWLAFGERLRGLGCRPLALVPCVRSRVDAALRRVFDVATLAPQRGVDAGPRRGDLVRELLARVSFAVRVEPGLLRACRRLSAEMSDPGLEADAWQHPLFISRYCDAGTLGPTSAVEPLIDQFEQAPADLRRRVLEQYRRWRGGVGCEILFEELSRLSTETRALLPQADHEELRQNWEWLAQQVERGDPHERSPVMDYAFRLLQRVSRQAELNPQIRNPLERMRSRFQQGGAVPKVLPDQFEVRVAQWGGELVLVGGEVDAPFASWPKESWLATLRARGPKVAIETVTFEKNMPSGSTWQTEEVGGQEVVKLALPEQGRLKVRTDCEGVTLEAASRSPSAIAAGRDRCGLWEETEIAGTTGKPVSVRWRWIPPGTFWMGSPEDEQGRYIDEGPRHLVTLTQGFWMAETPCTQEVWQSVMGMNPSFFKNKPQHPVEQASFRDLETFCQKINGQMSNEHVGLPTEAQWEYACRAGSPGAVYRVPGFPEQFPMDQKNNPAALEAIAWYSGNAGDKTHPVRTKLPNAWGLYDMLGNVWEWCRDDQRRYDSQSATDPVGAGESRVFRGGGWGSDARRVRCAGRSQFPVEYQDYDLGFRLVRVQKS